MDSFLKDIRYGARMLAKKPGFAAVAILTLALGIGANTALFSVVDAVLLRPLPFANPERLVRVTSDLAGQNTRDAGIGIVEMSDLQNRSDLFEEISGLYPVNANLTGIDEPERIEGLLVSPGYFRVLGTEAQLGRLFGPEDYTPGITEVAVISDGLWKRRFGAARNVIGKKVRLDNDLFTVIGVLRPGFRHPGRSLRGETEMWAPSGFAATPFREPRRGVFLLSGATARLKPGVSIELAQERLDAAVRQLTEEHSDAYPARLGWKLRVIPLKEDLVGNARQPLLILLSSVACLLLIACANVANLLLARGSARQRELAIRRAIGAGNRRIVRQMLTESLVLSVAGGAIGIILTLWSVDFLAALVPANIPRMADIAINERVMAFTLAVSMLTAVLFGLTPSFQRAGASTFEALKDQAHGSTSGSDRNRLRSFFVVAEIALALVLLISATLLVRSFWNLYKVDPGFNPAGLMIAHMWMPQPNDPATGPYFRAEARVALFKNAGDRIRAFPGVESVGWVFRMPLGGQRLSTAFWIEGQPFETSDSNRAEPFMADQGYFKSMQIRLVRGRYFDDRDNLSVAPVMIVSETFAKKFLPGEEPVGRRLRPGGRNSTAPWFTIVGVVGDVRSAGLEAEATPQIYRSILQTSSLETSLVVRTKGDPAALALPIRREVRAVDGELPIFGVATMNDVMSDVVAQRKFTMMLLAGFAAMALVLSSIGIYGVLSFTVQQRTSEFGIRVALGATRQDILGLVLGKGLGLAFIGVAAGLAAALAATRFMSSMLFGVAPADLPTFVGVAVLLIVIASLACYVPARRATRIDPIVALRNE